MNIRFTNDNLFQRTARKKLATVGIEVQLVANWVTCRDHDGNLHTVMSEQGVDDIVAKNKSEKE